MHGRELLENALRKHGIDDPIRIESHIRGVDLDLEVSEKTLDAGTTISVWIRDGGIPGKYGAPEDEDPSKLGIIVEGRHREIYRLKQAINVVSSIAASFPRGVVNEVGGEGGGIQYLLPPDWLDFVERIA